MYTTTIDHVMLYVRELEPSIAFYTTYLNLRVTEVVQGLKEGDRVVTAEMATKPQPASTPANPFSGSQRRFP